MDSWSEETKARHRAEIDAVRDLLLQCANSRRRITYGEVGKQIGKGAFHFRTQGQILGAISRDSYSERRVMLSAVVVDQTGSPGEGFFTLAQTLGLRFDDRLLFHRQELTRVFDAYSQTHG